MTVATDEALLPTLLLVSAAVEVVDRVEGSVALPLLLAPSDVELVATVLVVEDDATAIPAMLLDDGTVPVTSLKSVHS